MTSTPMFRIIVLVLGLISLPALGVFGAETLLRVMPSPPTVEADYGEMNGSWDVSLGYGRVWVKGPVSGSLNGAAAGLVWKGRLAGRVGFTVSPLFAGAYAGSVGGFSAETWSLGAGFSFGTRLLGRPESSNLVLFGGGLYSWSMDREDNVLGYGEWSAHLFGFSAGLKTNLQITRFVRFTPFYVYAGTGGFGRSRVDALPVTLTASGSTGYHDIHLLGLDFNIYGVTAKLVMDVFRDDFGTFTISIGLLDTVRGVRKALRD